MSVATNPIKLISRRTFVRLGIGGGVALFLMACKGSTPGISTNPTADPTADSAVPVDPGGPQDPDRELRAEVGGQQLVLIGLYSLAKGGLSTLVDARVALLGTRHEAYRQAISPDRSSEPATSVTPSGGSTSPSAKPSPTTSQSDIGTGNSLQDLIVAETASAARFIEQSMRASDPELVRLLVLAGAGSAAAAAVLRTLI